MKKPRYIIDFSITPAFIMGLCYAAKRGDRGGQRMRDELSLDPIAGKLIADFDAKKLRLGRGQPKGFVHEHLLERDDFIIRHVEHAQARLADSGRRNTLSLACWHVAHYLNKTGWYQKRPGDVYDQVTFERIRNVMRRHITRRNASRQNRR